MEPMTKAFVALGVGLVSLFGLVVVGLYIQPRSSLPFTPTASKKDLVERLHDPLTKVTAIKALAAKRCFLLLDDFVPVHGPRAIDITDEVFTAAELSSVAGRKVASFCDGATATLALPSSLREKRQTSVGDAPAIDVTKARKLWSHQRTNECMHTTLIDCGASTAGQAPAVYSCTTGPGQLFRSETTCRAANKFTLKMNHRCDECASTNKMRFIKCLQKWMLNLHSGCDD